MINTIKKAPGAYALGAFFMVWLWSQPALSYCPADAEAPRERVQVAHIIDGDTVRLQDGRRVRFLGVNAPEAGRDGGPDEPLAEAAYALLAERIPPGQSIGLVYDAEPKDRYGRVLAYVYDAKGRSVEAELLRRGLAFHVAVPPNLAQADCLRAQQDIARQNKLGVWADDYWQPTLAARLQEGGFQVVRGRVTDVSRTRGAIWLELDGPVVLQVSRADSALFDAEDWEAWLGRELLVSGWVIDRSGSRAVRRGFKPWMMRLRSPHGVLEMAAPAAD